MPSKKGRGSKRSINKKVPIRSESSTDSESSEVEYDNEDDNTSEQSDENNDSFNESSDSTSESSEEDLQMEIIKHVPMKKYGKDIREIIIKDIDDNYSWAIYSGFKVIIMKRNGYINCTKMCQYISEVTGSKKPFKNWIPTLTAKELINEISTTEGISAIDMMIIIKGGKMPEITGTYCFPELVPAIASWASPAFHRRACRIVNECLSREARDENDKQLQKKDDKIKKLNTKMNIVLKDNKTLKNQVDKLLDRADKTLEKNDELLTTTKSIKTKLNKISNDRVVKTGSKSDESVFYIMKNNDKAKKGQTNYSYGVIRVARKTLNSTLSAYKISHPQMRIITKIKYTPNSINLWTRIRTKLKKKKKIRVNGCQFNLLGDFSIDQLVEYVKRTHNERLNTENV